MLLISGRLSLTADSLFSTTGRELGVGLGRLRVLTGPPGASKITQAKVAPPPNDCEVNMRKLRTTGLLLIWTVLACYPNPLLLGRAIGQSWTPVVDAEAVRAVAATLPDDPKQIENAVLTSIVPYGVPWEVY